MRTLVQDSVHVVLQTAIVWLRVLGFLMHVHTRHSPSCIVSLIYEKVSIQCIRLFHNSSGLVIIYHRGWRILGDCMVLKRNRGRGGGGVNENKGRTVKNLLPTNFPLLSLSLSLQG